MCPVEQWRLWAKNKPWSQEEGQILFFYSREDKKIMKGPASSGIRTLEEVKRNSNCVSYEIFFSGHFQDSSKTGTAYTLWEATASGMRNQQSRACPRSLKKFVAKLRIEAKSRTPRLCVNHEGRGQELTRAGHNRRKGWKLDCQQKHGERRTKKREEEDGGREEERREARDTKTVIAQESVHQRQWSALMPSLAGEPSAQYLSVKNHSKT